MSNIIDSIQLSGTVYTLSAQTSGGGNPTVELTQAQYDALVTAGTVSADTYYIITDAQAGDLTNYYTKTEVDNAITAATSTKQDTLVSGTNIKTINNESILGSGNIDIQGGSGGKAIEAGRGISITTGETADTVSFNLPISAGTGTNSIIGGYKSNIASKSYAVALGSSNKASGDSSMAVNDYNVAGGQWSFAGGEGTNALGTASFSFGHSTTANSHSSFAIGYGNKTENEREFNCGSYGVSRKASNTFGDSGNTLFVVGNAYYANPRHNAFEIRQNGDIYITSGGTDIKLQDNLGGGGSITIDPSLDSGSTNAVANSAITNALHETYFYNIAKESDNKPETKFQLLWKYIDTKQTTVYNPYFVIAGINGKKIAALGSNPDRTNFELVETSAITTSVTSSSTDAQVPSAKAVNDKLGGLSIVKLTQSEYDNLATKDNSTLYVIVN